MDYLKQAAEAHKAQVKEGIDNFRKQMEKSSDIEQLLTLKQMTQITGALHEAQVLQLKYWFIGLTNCSKYTITFDPENSKIIYKVLETKGKVPNNINKNLDNLTEYVRFLLGNRFSVIIEDSPWDQKKKKVISKKKPSRSGKSVKKTRSISKRR